MRIFKYLKKYWFFAILAPLFMVGEVFMDLLQPNLMAQIVDIGLENGDLEFIIKIGLTMIGTVFVGGLFGILSGVFTNLAAFNYSNDMRKDLFNRVINLSFEQTDNFTTGSLVTRLTNDVTQVTNIVSMSMRMMIRQLMQFAMGIYFLLRISKEFRPILFVALPLMIVIMIFFLIKIAPLFGKVQERVDDVNAVVQENVTGARVVKAYTAEYKESKRFKKANDNLFDINWKIFKLMALLSPFINIIFCGAMVAILYIGGYNITNGGGLKIGELSSAITYISTILNGFLMLAMFFQSIVRGIASIKRLNMVLDCKPVVIEGQEEVVLEDEELVEETGTVEFKNVSFSYPNSSGEVVLDNINLKVNKGEKIGILGSTGCGKSTLVNLIPRFYDVTDGEVFVDGKNVKEYSFNTLRNKVAMVLQKSELYSGTIKDNICWGKEDATIEEVKYAASLAQADSFIESFNEGYDTFVAEKGASLSGGQKQRVSIARALIKKPEILIFDDSTSALDLKTEAELYKAINKDLSDMTIITIAQRVASVRNADKIVVLNDGKIASIGTHEELMESSPIYIDIYNSQLKKEGEE
ncbi:MAG: ABC transporter ATP-binding protein [Bacilli bacterium]|nr:ABC transporter ATP-binding protein [Bacilli bacterium]